MKKIIHQSFLVLVGISLFAGSALAEGVKPVKSATAPVTTPVSDETPGSTIKTALAEFNSLSKKERKLRIKDAKHELKEYKKEKRSGNAPSTNTLLLVILAILLPPLAVYLHEGVINNKFWISLLLTLLFFLPGVIYALIVVLGKD